MLFATLVLTAGTRQAEADTPPEVSRGFIYKNDQIREVPWSIHVLQIDRKRSDFELVTTLGHNRVLGLSPLTDQIRSIPQERGRPLAGMNGDFFYLERGPYGGDPRGVQILDGELVSAPDGKSSFWVDTNSQPHISDVVSQLKVIWPAGNATPLGLNEDRRPTAAVLFTSKFGLATRTFGGRELVLERVGQNAWLPLRAGQTYSARVRDARETGNTRLSSEILVLSLGPSLAARLPAVAPGTDLKLSMATVPDLSGVQTALGGGPVLLQDGKVQTSYEHRGNERHPRAAIGWNSKYFFFVAVDGRQPWLSMGMKLSEVAGYLAKLGCDEAMNLDGGGSVEMWIEGRIVNSPCFGSERPTANGIVLLKKINPQAGNDALLPSSRGTPSK